MARSPEEWLEEVAPAKTQGIFKLFLGYAPGVGKTYAMLSEGIRRSSRGEDVVIGIIETHGRKAVVELASKLETVPRRIIEYKGTEFHEMDLEAILQRRPRVVLVDELAHSNIDGSLHRKRYEDVMELLATNIDVLSTMNVQHIESLGPSVMQISGVQVRETVPDWVMQRVDEIVLADVTPQALQSRMNRGDIYPVERAERSLAHFFKPGNLIALRELALRQVTQVVDRSLDAYLAKEHSDKTPDVRERIAVCISSNPAAQYLIARAARMAQAIKGDLFVVYVDIGQDASPQNQRTLTENIRFAQNLGGTFVSLKGKSVAEEVAKLVREKRITQVIFGRSAQTGWKKYLYLTAIQRFLRDAPPVDVHRDPGGAVVEHPHILVVDDEPQITRVLRTTLSAKGYDIRVANDGEMALEIMKDWSPNLVITDLMMPNMDGVQLCKRIRAMSEIPIIVLSVRGEERNKIQALDAGADDYITKPFSSGELQARVRAALRRAPKAQTQTRESIAIGDFHIDLASRQVKVRDTEVKLTPKEFELLTYLAEHPHRVITHRNLLGAIWGEMNTEQPEYLRVFVGQLRKKIEKNPADPKYLLTDRWVGYRFEPGA